MTELLVESLVLKIAASIRADLGTININSILDMNGNEIRNTILQKLIYEGGNSRMLVFEDFIGPKVGAAPVFDVVRVVPAGVGAGSIGAGAADKTNRPGIVRQSTGTSVNGRSFIISDSINGFHVGIVAEGITRVGTWLRVGPILAVPAQDYHLRAGMMSVAAAPPSVIIFGVGFEYDQATSLNWQIFADAAGLTATPTTVLVNIDQDYFLEVEVNAAGDSVEYFIDGASVGTIAIAANIPRGPGFNMFYNEHIYKVGLGTLARTYDSDALYIYKELAR